MRDLFPGYYRPTNQQLQQLWGECLFVFDTNVLLDLYRYPKQTREELLALFQKISERTWIPFQVALEYQENRLAVISEQVKRYDEVRKALIDLQNKLSSEIGNLQLKKRHSSINPDKLLSGVDELIKSFLENVQGLRKEQPDIHDDDKLREQIDLLFEGKIGPIPSSQAELDKIYTEGKERYDRLQPPGYMDRPKEKSDKEAYLYRGLIIKKEFGDLILWKQLIDELIQRQSKFVIFVTNDEKEDWWWSFDSSGKRIIGPRHELVEELTEKAGIQLFYMYNTERFLVFARDYFKVPVSQESIDQVRDITRVNRPSASYTSFSTQAREAEQLVFDWLVSLDWVDDVNYNDIGFPDFVAMSQQSNEKVGYQVRFTIDERSISIRLREDFYRGYYQVNEGQLDKFNLVVVLNDPSIIDRVRRIIGRLEIPKNVTIIYGKIEILAIEGGIEKRQFVPIG